MTQQKIETSHAEISVVPVADAFSGTVAGDVLSLKDHARIRWIIVEGAGGTGTYTVTVEACDDTTPSNTSAVPFQYRVTTAGSQPGARTAATSAGFTSTAGANKVIEVEIEAAALLAAGYGYARLKTVEVVNDPILGGVIAILEDARFSGRPASATV